MNVLLHTYEYVKMQNVLAWKIFDHVYISKRDTHFPLRVYSYSTPKIIVFK